LGRGIAHERAHLLKIERRRRQRIMHQPGGFFHQAEQQVPTVDGTMAQIGGDGFGAPSVFARA
jgi:hypothetical protein